MVKRCIYEGCRSDSRKKSVIQRGISFLPFPKPISRPESAERWCSLIGRPGFSIKDITPHSYVCSLHFKPWEVLNIKANPTLEPTPGQMEPPAHKYDTVRYPQLPAASLQQQPPPPPARIKYKSPPALPLPLPPPPTSDANKVRLTAHCATPYYLTPEVLASEHGGKVMLLGMDGNRVTVNRLVFACMSRLAGSLNQEDEENVISTELTGEDLQTVAEFLMTGRLPGQSDAQTVALFSHVGISLRGMKVVKIKVVDGQVEDNLTQDLVKSEQENYFVQQDRSRKRRVDHEEGDLSSESKVQRTESKIDSPPSSADVRQQSAVSQQDPIASSDSLTECYRNSRNLVVETDVVEAGTENDSILPQTLSNPKERTTIIDIKIEPQDILNDEFTIGELVDGVFNNREEEEEEDHDSEVEGEELRELEDWVVD